MVRYLFYTIGDLTYQSPLVLVRMLCGPALFRALLIILSLSAVDQGTYGLFASTSNTTLFSQSVPDNRQQNGPLPYVKGQWEYLNLKERECLNKARVIRTQNAS